MLYTLVDYLIFVVRSYSTHSKQFINYWMKCVNACSFRMYLPTDIYMTSRVCKIAGVHVCWGRGEKNDHRKCITKHKLRHVLTELVISLLFHLHGFHQGATSNIREGVVVCYPKKIPRLILRLLLPSSEY